MSSHKIENETDTMKTSSQDEIEKDDEKKSKMAKENSINIKSILDLNNMKSINDATKYKISKMEIDIDVNIYNLFISNQIKKVKKKFYKSK